jgi:hypothetical protein
MSLKAETSQHDLLIRSKIRLVQIRPSLSIRPLARYTATWQFQPYPCSSRFVVSNRVSKIGVASGRSDNGAYPSGSACGGRAAKVKPAAGAGPTRAGRRGSTFRFSGVADAQLR